MFADSLSQLYIQSTNNGGLPAKGRLPRIEERVRHSLSMVLWRHNVILTNSYLEIEMRSKTCNDIFKFR